MKVVQAPTSFYSPYYNLIPKIVGWQGGSNNDMKRTFWIVFSAFLATAAIIFHSCGSNDLKLTWKSPILECDKQNITIKAYIENSGSMDGYMCNGSELKDAVKSYLSNLNRYSDSLSLNYINTQIIYRGSNIKDFISNINPNSFAQAGGNRANSDISKMLEMVLEARTENEVTLFVSDCIMDVPDGNATKFFTDRKIDISNAFVNEIKKDKNLGVEVLRLLSRYTGSYYYYQGMEKIDTIRPYYIFVIGNKHVLSQLNTKTNKSEIEHGVQNYCAFSTSQEVPFVITNKFGTANSKVGECISKSKEGECVFNMKVDFRSTLQDDNVICDVANYKYIGSNLSINNIVPVKEKNSDYSHVINFSVNDGTKPYGEMIELKSILQPSWVEAVNDDTGKDIIKNVDKTTGIKYIIGGIADAYKEVESIASVKFTVGIK